MGQSTAVGSRDPSTELISPLVWQFPQQGYYIHLLFLVMDFKNPNGMIKLLQVFFSLKKDELKGFLSGSSVGQE